MEQGQDFDETRCRCEDIHATEQEIEEVETDAGVQHLPNRPPFHALNIPQKPTTDDDDCEAMNILHIVHQ